jgi:type 1 glutamine amidotransferase
MKPTIRPLLAIALALTSSFSASGEEAKRVIVCSVTKGFRHSSIPLAEKCLERLATESKAFTVVDWVRLPEKADMDKLSPANLTAKKIDAVIFANTTGDLPLPDREGFIKWIEDGHGFCAMHSASDTFHGFPGYIDMLQGEFDGHGAQVPADLKAGDTAHPANGGIGETWELAQEEMYRIKNHDRTKIRALWFLRHDPNDKAKVGYNAVAWCRMAGKGRVFYTSLGHREDLWDDTAAAGERKNPEATSKQFQAHLLGGIKWSLGLAAGSSTPNPEVK